MTLRLISLQNELPHCAGRPCIDCMPGLDRGNPGLEESSGQTHIAYEVQKLVSCTFIRETELQIAQVAQELVSKK